MMSAKFSLQAPTFDVGDLESYNLWLSEFKRHIKVTKPNDNDTLELFLLCAGNKAAKFYNEVTWPDLTQAQTDAGITEYSRAVEFVTSKFSAGRKILSDRIKLSSTKQKSNQSLKDFLSELRQIAKFCNFPNAFSDKALRDASCQGLQTDTTKRAVCRGFAAANQKAQAFSLDDAASAAEVEEAAQQSSGPVEVFAVAANKHRAGLSKFAKKEGSSGGKRRCHWCGSSTLHGKADCPAKEIKCHKCGRVGHLKSVCMSTKNVAAVAGQSDDSNVVAGLSFKQRERRFVNVLIKGTQKPWLLDCGSDISVVDKKFAKEQQIPYKPLQGSQVRSVSNNGLAIIGRAKVRMSVEETTFFEVVFVAEQLCDSAILGSSALAKFQSLTINYGGLAPPLIVASQCSDSSSDETAGFVNIDPFPIINLTEDAVPVRCPSRFRTESDKQFVADEISK